ncbi:MAG: hypothetical protein H7175_13630 [Burkholderiales bacterium]|nr:hypothetical protein [Anaerolineae bacterium]
MTAFSRASLPTPDGDSTRLALSFALPAVIAGGIAWLLFVVLGETPPLRAAALALVIVGISLTLRWLGTSFAISGGLALAFSPAFWSQTGGTESANALLVVAAVAIAGVAVILVTVFSRRPLLAAALGIVIFVAMFWTQIAAVRSLRITTLTTAWLLFLLINTVRRTNPRPDESLPIQPRRYQSFGLLLLLAIGVINDPLFTLMAPALLLALFLGNIVLPRWYWAALVIVTVAGIYGIATTYVGSSWLTLSAARADELGVVIPRVIADGWREPSRWIKLFDLVIGQFTVIGVLLGVMGLARMARWYPVLGVVLMIAYAAYAVFGLVYFGGDSDVLLLPLLMIQVIWMTYAVYTLGQWLQHSVKSNRPIVRWLAPAVFTLLPLLMLMRIAGVV